MFVFLGLSVASFVIVVGYLIKWFVNLPSFRIGKFQSPPGHFLIGHGLFLNTTKKVLWYLNENLSKYNGLMTVNVGVKTMLVVSDYEFLEWILKSTKYITKSEEYEYLQNWLGNGILLATGPHWKSHRKILTPAFHFQMMNNHIKSFQKSSDILIEKLHKTSDKNSIDVYSLIASFTLDAVCESSMATSIKAQEKNDSVYVTAVQNICRILISRAYSLTKMSDFLFKFYEDSKIFNDSVDTIHTFVDSVIKERKKILESKPVVEEDVSESVYDCSRNKSPFLDILLKSRDENGQPLSDIEIRDEVNTIMFAGYETTASAVSFALYNLAKYPEVQSRVIEEQISLFGNEANPTTITHGNICDMKYLEMVIKESLRLFPPIPFIGRKITEDYYYEGKLLPKGLTCTLFIFNLHRNPDLWPNPEKFDPSRFEDETSRPAYAYLPFSAGPRNCIGQKFALIELKEVISKIVRNFEILPSTDSDIELVAETSLKSSNGVCLKLKKRVY